MHQTFQISPPDMIASETNFFGELSNEGFSFFLQNNNDKVITGLSAYIFEKKDVANNIAEALERFFSKEDIPKEKFNRTFISYSFNESILTPGLYYSHSENNKNLDLVYGDIEQGLIFTEHVAQNNLYNTYRIPKKIYNIISSRFDAVACSHQYSLLIKQHYKEDILKLIFYRSKIIILLQKANKLQIIQSFNYTTSEDVLYHMINVCRQFDVNNINTELCGMIEKDSALFQEIEKYLLHITFSELPQELLYADELKDIPSHFFSQLFAFALCV